MDNNPSFSLETGAIVGVVLYALILVVAVWANVRIIRRAGYSGWWILIGLVPLVNIVMYLMFAFKEWPIQRELAHLRAVLGGGGYPYGRPPGYGPPPGPPPSSPSHRR